MFRLLFVMGDVMFTDDNLNLWCGCLLTDDTLNSHVKSICVVYVVTRHYTKTSLNAYK